mgnify:CR=1 FL=1
MSAQTTDEVQVTVASIDLLGGALRSLDAAITSSREALTWIPVFESLNQRAIIKAITATVAATGTLVKRLTP